ncbi:DUF3899 domain-containing protein [Sporosarcina sp. FSL K6-1522]|uniref:DUF3899 domain-containing protein n=1 Tax=Sporosarcina sp. FSL K6-1522 TaxID=2921554 RepID=UPI003159E07A
MTKVMKKKAYKVTFIFIALVAVLFLIFDVSVVLWDQFFLIGLVLFMFGGGLWLLGKGVFDFFLYSFAKLLKNSSKAEAYVSLVNGESKYPARSAMTSPFAQYTLFTGITIIVITTIFPYYLF